MCVCAHQPTHTHTFPTTVQITVLAPLDTHNFRTNGNGPNYDACVPIEKREKLTSFPTQIFDGDGDRYGFYITMTRVYMLI